MVYFTLYKNSPGIVTITVIEKGRAKEETACRDVLCRRNNLINLSRDGTRFIEREQKEMNKNETFGRRGVINLNILKVGEKNEGKVERIHEMRRPKRQFWSIKTSDTIV